MTTQLQFKPCFGGAAVYLAQASLDWNDESAPESLGLIRPFASFLFDCLSSLGMDEQAVWLGLLNASAQFESNLEMATIFLKRVKGGANVRADEVSRLVAAISSLESAVRRLHPDLESELSLRIGPLREQWEARGPGMMHYLARTTDADLAPSSATAALVAPVRGGGGVALLASNTVIFEGVLTNGNADLPESLRLAWLVAQLQLDLPKFSEAIPAARLPRVAALALLPPILEAAREVEFVPNSAVVSPKLLRVAIESWHPPVADAAALAETLMHWREAQVESQTPWRVALAGLDRLLGD